MVCESIKKIALYVFWNCLNEEERQKNIKEHHYSKLNVEKIKDIEDSQNELKDNITILKNELILVKNKIENNVDKREVLSDIEKILKDRDNE